MSRIIHFFGDADMRCSHNGLKLLAAKQGVNADLLSENEYILFINRRRSMFKLLGSGNIILFIKGDNGTVDLATLNYLPKRFTGDNFSYKKALRQVIEKKLIKRRQK